MRWTSEMEAAVKENVGMGTEWLRRMLRRRFGADLTAMAVERKCYRMGLSPRMGVSLGKGCAECGRRFRRSSRGQDLCPECRARAMRERQLRVRDEIEEGERRAAAISTDYERLRKWNQRHR